jgi:hypothetical protein
MVQRILENENYIGNFVYNRMSRHLGQKAVSNPPHMWIRSTGALEPIIEPALFIHAQKIMAEWRVDLSEDEMLARLRKTLIRRGRLSTAIINETVGLPCTATYMAHFGTIRNAYRLIGYISKRDCDWIDSGHLWSQEIARLASWVAAAIEKAGGHISGTRAADSMLVNNKVGISFRVARWWTGKKVSHAPRWAVYRGKYLPAGWIVVIRLAQLNKAVLDYLLLPTSALAERMIKFTDKARSRHKAIRFECVDTLVRSVIGHTTMPSCASPTKPAQPTKRSRSSRSKRTSGRAQR